MHLSRQTAAESLFIAFAPIAGFFALQICLINQDFNADPWFYTGYGQEFKSLQQLFGWTYYAVRFPVILLNLAVPKALDPVVGFAIVRYFLFLSCGVPLYLWARHYFGIIYAIAAYLFLFCNPLFPRLLLWDLTPFVSVPMALAGMTLWQLPTKPNAVNRLLSGFAFCASVASHAFTGTAIAVFFLVEAARRLIKREYSDLVLLDVAVPVAGAFLCFAIGIACYYVILGPFDPSIFFTVTLDAARAGDQFSASHSSEFSVWIWKNTNTLVPVVLVGFVAIGFTGELFKDTVIARVWWFSLLYCAAYAVYEFLLHRFVLETFFYFFHLSLVVYLLFPVCLHLVTRGLTRKDQTVVVGIAIAVLIAMPIFKDHFIIAPATLKESLTKFEALSIFGTIIVVVAVWSARYVIKVAVVAAVYAIALVCVVQVLTLSSRAYAAIYSKPQQAKEYDKYRAAVEMVRIFGAYATPSQRVMLWYPWDDSGSMMSIASPVLLYGVNKAFQEGGLPNIGEYESARLKSPDLKYIMMLSENSDSIVKGKEALVLHGYDFRDVENRTIGGEYFKADLDLIELIDAVRARALAQSRSVLLDTMRLAGQNASLHLSASGLTFHSAPDPWSYIGRMPLAANCFEGGGWVAADISVTHGTAGIGVLNRKGDDFLVSEPVTAADDVRTVYLQLDSFAAAGDLIVRNWDEKSSSEGVIQSVRIAAENGSTPAACDPDPARTKALAQARSVSLGTMRLVGDNVSMHLSSSGLAFRSAPEPWAYIGRMPLSANCFEGGGWIAANVSVTHGTAVIGVLNRQGDDFLVSEPVAAADDMHTIYLRLDSFAAAGDLIVRNWDEKSSSEGVIQNVRIAAENGSTPAACDPDPARTKVLAQARFVSLDTMRLVGENASVHLSASGLPFRSAPEPWAYIGRMPLSADCLESGGWIATDIRVTHGSAGVGVLNRKGDNFLALSSASVGTETQTVYVRIESFAAAGDLILFNWDKKAPSEGTLEAVRVAADTGQPLDCPLR